jgi:hypothetical protein
MSARTLLVTAATAVAVAGSVAGATVARADGAPPTTSASPSGSSSGSSGSSGSAGGHKLARVCALVPFRIERLELLQKHLNADADTPGSLAFLTARADRAADQGHSDRSKLLTDRLAVRRDVAARLPDMLTHLRDARATCDGAQSGTGAGGASSSASGS